MTDVVVERSTDESLTALCACETGARRRHALLLQCHNKTLRFNVNLSLNLLYRQCHDYHDALR